jgi:hypothetical protein
MDFKIVSGILLGIALLYYGIFKLKLKEKPLHKILVLIIAITAELAVVGKLLFWITIFFPIVLIGGLVAIFSALTAVAWKERKNPENKTYVYAYFSVMGFIVLFAITVFILAKTGFFG